MTITLTVGGTVATLPEDLLWSDETQWSPVLQSAEHTLTGALIVSVAQRLAGRPITLQPPDESAAWMSRAVLEQLLTWAAIPGQQMVLGMRAVNRTVMWRHQDAPALSAEPVVHFSDVDAADFYLTTLRLIQI